MHKHCKLDFSFFWWKPDKSHILIVVFIGFKLALGIPQGCAAFTQLEYNRSITECSISFSGNIYEYYNKFYQLKNSEECKQMCGLLN